MFRIRKYNFHFWKNFPNLRREIAAKSPQKWLKRRKSPQNRRKKTGSKLTQKRPDEGLYIDARIGSSINNLKKVYQNGNHFH